jgi:hypothetical protein
VVPIAQRDPRDIPPHLRPDPTKPKATQRKAAPKQQQTPATKPKSKPKPKPQPEPEEEEEEEDEEEEEEEGQAEKEPTDEEIETKLREMDKNTEVLARAIDDIQHAIAGMQEALDTQRALAGAVRDSLAKKRDEAAKQKVLVRVLEADAASRAAAAAASKTSSAGWW